MKGLILAGGNGTRLRPITYSGPKQLVPIANKPIIFYVVDKLVDADITDICIIVSPETQNEIKSALGDGSSWGAKFTYIEQHKPLGLAHAVKCAQSFIGNDKFCLFLGDNLIGSPISFEATKFELSGDDARLMIKQVDNPHSFGVAEIDGEGKVVGLEEKPAFPKSNFVLIGIYFFTSEIFNFIDSISPSARGEYEITDVINLMMSSGRSIAYSTMNSWWLDTGKKDDLLLANDTVLDDMAQISVKGDVDQQSTINGRVSIGSGSKIIRSKIRGPVVIGANVTLVDAIINPFTSIGDSVLVERSTIEHSVVMNDSRILDISRLEDSLIGRRVLIHPGSANYGSVSLFVGDDSKIELNKS